MANQQQLQQGSSGMITFSLGATGKVPIISYLKPQTSGLITLSSVNFQQFSTGAAPGIYGIIPTPDMVSTVGTLMVLASGNGTTQQTIYVDITPALTSEVVPQSITEYVSGSQKFGVSLGGPIGSGSFYRR